MSSKKPSAQTNLIRCETCPMREKAEANPKAILSRLWRWHTTWCPGWKAYQASLTDQTELKPSD